MAVTKSDRQQSIAGLMLPQFGEAVIRIVWPSVARFPAVASLGRILTNTIVLAPLGWVVMAPFYFIKVVPIFGLACRYAITNRKVAILRGVKQVAQHEVPLAAIDEVRIVKDANSEFFRSATLEIVSEGVVKLSLPGVTAPEAFREAILNSVMAWIPGKAAKLEKFFPAIPPK